MNKKIIFLTALAIAAVSCKGPNIKPAPKGESIAFATDWNSNLELGIYADKPVSVSNVKADFKNHSLTLSEEIHWPADMPDSSVRFGAYAPYDKSFGDTDIFNVKSDQSSDANFTASDLLIAATKASVSSPFVDLEFKHALVKLIVYVKGDKVSKVQALKLSPSAFVDFLKGEASNLTAEADITAHMSFTEEDGVQAYELLVAPQEAAVTLEITDANGTHEVKTASSLNMVSGKTYVCKKVIVTENDKNSLHFTQAEWIDTPEKDYVLPGESNTPFVEYTTPGVYSLIGDNAEELFIFDNATCQTVASSGLSGKYIYRILDLKNACYVSLSLGASSFTTGKTVSASVETSGIDAPASISNSLTVSQVKSNLIWLEDKTSNIAYIISK